MIALPPSEGGAVQVSDTLVLVPVAESPVGAPGVVAGIADASFDASDESTVLIASTVK